MKVCHNCLVFALYDKVKDFSSFQGNPLLLGTSDVPDLGLSTDRA